MREPIDKNLHFHFELITEPSDPTEETKFNGDTIAEEHFNDTEIENTDHRRQANPTSLLDKKNLRQFIPLNAPIRLTMMN